MLNFLLEELKAQTNEDNLQLFKKKINKYINENQNITINLNNQQNEIENLNNIQKDIIDILN